MEIIETLDAMERVLALRRVPLFADVALEDLEALALAAAERRYPPDVLVFARNEVGSEMLVIIEGGVLVRTGAGRPSIELGTGEIVGELSLLRGRPRIADVISGPEGVLGLVLDGATLRSVLTERPQVALRMLTTLAEKLASASNPQRNRVQ